MRSVAASILGGALFALASPAHALGAHGKVVGWYPHPFFVEAAGGRDAPDLRREFYPKGERAAKWSERVVMTSRSRGKRASAGDVLDALAAERRRACQGFDESRMPVADDIAPREGASMWHCNRNAAGQGEVGMHRVVVAPDRVYVVTAEARYAPFAAGASPLRREQLDRWAAFQRTFSLCADWTAPGCGPDPEPLMTAGPAAPDAAEARAIARAEARGRELFRQDQLASHGSDFAKHKNIATAKRDGGFLAVPGAGRAGRVYFFEFARRPRVLGGVEYDARGKPSLMKQLRRLPDDLLPRYQALARARATNPKVCSDRANTAVLPAEEGGWLVYMLTSTTQQGLIWLGVHTRLHVDAAGKRVLRSEQSTLTCFAIDMHGMPKGADGLVTPTATHLVSDVPWETHVFQSLTFATPILVITRAAAWRVDGGRIAKLAIE